MFKWRKLIGGSEEWLDLPVSLHWEEWLGYFLRESLCQYLLVVSGSSEIAREPRSQVGKESCGFQCSLCQYSLICTVGPHSYPYPSLSLGALCFAFSENYPSRVEKRESPRFRGWDWVSRA